MELHQLLLCLSQHELKKKKWSDSLEWSDSLVQREITDQLDRTGSK